MKKFSFLLILISAFSLQSCVDIVEILSIKKNGSGTYELVIDMSSLVNNPMMKEMFMESLKKGEAFGDAIVDGVIELDTLVDMKNNPMADVGAEVPKIMEKVKTRIQMSDSKGIFKTTMTLKFEEVSEIAEFYKALEDTGGQQAGPGMGGMLPTYATFEFKRRTISRKELSNKSNDEEDNPLKKEVEAMGMMKMMMSGAKFTSVYHLPKKPKKIDFPDAKIDGKTVTVSHSIVDIMDGKAELAGSIKY